MAPTGMLASDNARARHLTTRLCWEHGFHCAKRTVRRPSLGLAAEAKERFNVVLDMRAAWLRPVRANARSAGKAIPALYSLKNAYATDCCLASTDHNAQEAAAHKHCSALHRAYSQREASRHKGLLVTRRSR